MALQNPPAQQPITDKIVTPQWLLWFNAIKDFLDNGIFSQVLVNKATGLIGYTTGAGGTVTQATSKGTSVILNKPTGQITMHNAALAAGAVVGFPVTNSLVTLSDVVVCSIKNGSVTSVGNYSIITSPGGGAFEVWVRNVSAGGLSEAVIISYSVIKGATT